MSEGENLEELWLGVGGEFDVRYAGRVEEVWMGGGDDENCGEVWDLFYLLVKSGGMTML